jgi:hypothetical protein
VDACEAKRFETIGTIAHQPTCLSKFIKLKNGWNGVVQRQQSEIFHVIHEQSITSDHESGRSDRLYSGKCLIKIVFGACVYNVEIHAKNAGSRLQIPRLRLGGNISRIDGHSKFSRRGQEIVQRLQSLWQDFRA